MSSAASLLLLIDAAEAANDAPDAALARIGVPPWIDSRREADRFALRTARFAPDPAAPAEFIAPGTAAEAVYWGVPARADVAIAGLVWDAARRARRFRAVVLAP